MSYGQIYSSISRIGVTEPFDLQVARGQINAHSVVNINGFQAAVAGTPIPLWENATVYTFPSSALTMTLVSTSTSDVGVNITVNGLDANYNMISEVVVLNGTTGVTTVNQYLRINSLITTLGKAVGVVTAANGGTTYAQINAGLGRSQMSIYTVPNGYTLYVPRINCWTGSTALGTNWILYNLVTTNNATGGTVTQYAQISFFQNVDVHRYVPNTFTQKTDVQFLFSSSDSSNQHVSMYAEGYLIQTPTGR